LDRFRPPSIARRQSPVDSPEGTATAEPLGNGSALGETGGSELEPWTAGATGGGSGGGSPVPTTVQRRPSRRSA
jgi:hypothetical protein